MSYSPWGLREPDTTKREHGLLARTARQSGKCSPVAYAGGRGPGCGELLV